MDKEGQKYVYIMCLFIKVLRHAIIGDTAAKFLFLFLFKTVAEGKGKETMLICLILVSVPLIPYDFKGYKHVLKREILNGQCVIL